jgi:ribosomal protein L16 Arg81 hydroxylase
LFGVGDLDHEVGRIIDSMADRLSQLTDRRAEQKASGIWIGSKGVTTPLHHDAWTGLLFQLTGSKRVLMFPPEDRANLYFTSPFAATDRWSTLPGRSDDADLAEYPRFARASRHEGQLDAGDVLFIPPFWAHEVEALEANISIPFRFETRPIDHLNPGFLRPAYEIVDRKLVAPRRAG